MTTPMSAPAPALPPDLIEGALQPGHTYLFPHLARRVFFAGLSTFRGVTREYSEGVVHRPSQKKRGTVLF